MAIEKIEELALIDLQTPNRAMDLAWQKVRTVAIQLADLAVAIAESLSVDSASQDAAGQEELERRYHELELPYPDTENTILSFQNLLDFVRSRFGGIEASPSEIRHECFIYALLKLRIDGYGYFSFAPYLPEDFQPGSTKKRTPLSPRPADVPQLKVASTTLVSKPSKRVILRVNPSVASPAPMKRPVPEVRHLDPIRKPSENPIPQTKPSASQSAPMERSAPEDKRFVSATVQSTSSAQKTESPTAETAYAGPPVQLAHPDVYMSLIAIGLLSIPIFFDVGRSNWGYWGGGEDLNLYFLPFLVRGLLTAIAIWQAVMLFIRKQTFFVGLLLCGCALAMCPLPFVYVGRTEMCTLCGIASAVFVLHLICRWISLSEQKNE